jgi:glycosyltransferase involved in cell wall biosynthesis
MEIVINTIPLLSPLTGVGHYIYNLLIEFQRLRPDIKYTFYYGYFGKKLKAYREGEGVGFYRLKEWVKKMPVVSPYARKLKDTLAQINLKKYDLYFEPDFIPLNIRSKKIVATVHDFSFHLHPEWHPRERTEYFFRSFFKRIEKADLIITVSRYIEREAFDLFNGKDLRIVTIYNGYNDVLFHPNKKAEEEKTSPSGNYILFVGSGEPRKNLLGLLKAYLLLPEYMKKDFQLLLTGSKGGGNQEIVERMEQLKGRVHYLGYLNNEELAALYRGASCLVFPSFYEGFGLPPLEAMACGCPVIVSNVASLPEVCGEAAYYINPYNGESIAEGIYQVLTDGSLRQSLIQKGLERAALFSWEKSAREHLKVFEEVSGNSQ